MNEYNLGICWQNYLKINFLSVNWIQRLLIISFDWKWNFSVEIKYSKIVEYYIFQILKLELSFHSKVLCINKWNKFCISISTIKTISIYHFNVNLHRNKRFSFVQQILLISNSESNQMDNSELLSIMKFIIFYVLYILPFNIVCYFKKQYLCNQHYLSCSFFHVSSFLKLLKLIVLQKSSEFGFC